MRIAACLVAGLVASTVYASEPGQPLDCSDWVFLEPGHGCSVFVPYGCNAQFDLLCYSVFRRADFDNQSRMYSFDQEALPSGICGSLGRLKLVRYDGATTTTVAYIDSRCATATRADRVVFNYGMNFDAVAGALVAVIGSYCTSTDGSCTYSTNNFMSSVMKVTGFTPLFDIMQTYAADSAQLDFRIPVRPEGLPAADHFDTYYGALTHPIDFSQAQGLACDYPASVPAVGEYLEVADTLPDPAPGAGRYYVTAATYQGQTRYGRKTTNRVMSGRDPAGLPGCGK